MNSNQYYDKHKRNQEARSFYKSKAWEKCRTVVLMRDNYLCQHCLKQGKITPADMVHHIEELLEHPEKALDEDNLVSLCHPCHNKEHPEKGQTKKKPKRSSKVRVIESKANEEWV